MVARLHPFEVVVRPQVTSQCIIFPTWPLYSVKHFTYACKIKNVTCIAYVHVHVCVCVHGLNVLLSSCPPGILEGGKSTRLGSEARCCRRSADLCMYRHIELKPRTTSIIKLCIMLKFFNSKPKYLSSISGWN